MKLIKPSFEIIEQGASMDGMYKHIELAGRLSYKSEHLITETSSTGFVNRMIKNGHGAVLEHGTVYLKVPTTIVRNSYFGNASHSWVTLIENPYTVWKKINGNSYFTTNYRVIFENGLDDLLDYMVDPIDGKHERRVSVKFIMDRVGSQSFCRHRAFSFLQESTRYCDYSKNKFNNEVTFIEPVWSTDNEGNMIDDIQNAILIDEFEHSEKAYFNLLKEHESTVPESKYKNGYKHNPWTAEQARIVLPGGIKTEIIMTGFVKDWWGKTYVVDESSKIVATYSNSSIETDIATKDQLKKFDDGKHNMFKNGFFGLRCSSHAHPQAQELAYPLRDEFIKRGWL